MKRRSISSAMPPKSILCFCLAPSQHRLLGSLLMKVLLSIVSLSI